METRLSVQKVRRLQAVGPAVMLDSSNTTFVLLSFEGPDRYSLAGGLGVRVSQLAETLASLGYETHLLFIGDPFLKGWEIRRFGKGNLTLHRWCQWVSKFHPMGVYDGEEGKLHDFTASAPAFLAESIIGPAIRQGRHVVVMAEEWQTTEAVCVLSEILRREGLADRALILWNANNTYSFERIDWPRLTQHAILTTVSRYMKHIMWNMGLNPLVIPNGIPPRFLAEIGRRKAWRLQQVFGDRLVLSKTARFAPDKRWNMAVEAVAQLKAKGLPVLMLARGGLEAHGAEVLEHAQELGLSVEDVHCECHSFEEHVSTLGKAGPADVLNLKFYLNETLSRLIYQEADAVLANSGHEPFGLVGLETMAAGGIAFTGSTGEDYAVSLKNAIVLETDDPGEIVEYLIYLEQHPEERETIRREAKITASRYTWEEVVHNLMAKVQYLANRHFLIEQRHFEYSEQSHFEYPEQRRFEFPSRNGKHSEFGELQIEHPQPH